MTAPCACQERACSPHSSHPWIASLRTSFQGDPNHEMNNHLQSGREKRESDSILSECQFCGVDALCRVQVTPLGWPILCCWEIGGDRERARDCDANAALVVWSVGPGEDVTCGWSKDSSSVAASVASQSPGWANTSNLAPVPVFLLETSGVWGSSEMQSANRSNRTHQTVVLWPLQAPSGVQHVMKHCSFLPSRGTDEYRRAFFLGKDWPLEHVVINDSEGDNVFPMVVRSGMIKTLRHGVSEREG